MSSKVVRVEISKNIAGGLSLCVCDESGGQRISGGKVGGCETLKVFTVNAEELVDAIRNYAYLPKDEN
ncbi:hypothetical protein [Staphylococcus aureus]|uniref:hypothetical protein n=1 Tax=Staphylococcus aureus TaxID=1280 RepID=UPI002E18F510|nr:hypothetical protein [Staphylococcus aureus]